MKFNSNSVALNRGVNYRYPIETPSSFKHYKFRPNVFRKAVEEFNQKLDHRPHVTMHIDGVKADVLRLVPTTDDTLAMWLVVKEKDVDKIHKICFTLKGDVYFDGDSEEDVDHMVIEDVLFNNDHGIFLDKKR